MAVAVVDTSILISYKNTGETNHHSRAEAMVQAFDAGELPTGRVTNYVLLETLNWIHARQRHDIAVDLHRRLAESAGFEIVHAAQQDFHRAVDLFETYDALAFGDTTIAAYMEREGIEYLYSFDDDFDVLDDITRLDTADNPY